MTKRNCRDGCPAHQGKFIKKITFQDAFGPNAQHIVAAQYIRQGVKQGYDQPVRHVAGQALIRDHADGNSTADMPMLTSSRRSPAWSFSWS